jgi:uncharacterized protein YciI
MRLSIFFCFALLTHSVVAQQYKYSFVFLNKNVDADSLTEDQSSKIMSGHMANIKKLAAEKKLLAAGPFEGGGGIFILNTTSYEEAQNWLSADPGVQAKRWNIEILPYEPRVGSVCSVSAPYEMVTYSFIRFIALVTKFTAGTYPKILKEHADYIKQLSLTGNVITEGIFGGEDGGILIMKGDVQREVFESDPGVEQGLLDLEIKKLYIARGSFCEK